MDNLFSSIKEGFDKKLSQSLSKQLSKDYNRPAVSMDKINKSYHWTERTFTNDRGTTYKKRVKEADAPTTNTSSNGTNFFDTPLGKLTGAIKVTDNIKAGTYDSQKTNYILSKVKQSVSELDQLSELPPKEKSMLDKVKQNLKDIYKPVVPSHIDTLDNAITALENKVKGTSYLTPFNSKEADIAYSVIRYLPEYILSSEQQKKVNSLKERFQKVRETSEKNKEAKKELDNTRKALFSEHKALIESEIKPKLDELNLGYHLERDNSIAYLKDFVEATKPTIPKKLKALSEALSQKGVQDSVTNVINTIINIKQGRQESVLDFTDVFGKQTSNSPTNLQKVSENTKKQLDTNKKQLLEDISKVKLVSDESSKLGKEWFLLAKNYSKAKDTLKKINSGERVTQQKTWYDDYAEAGVGQWKRTSTVNVTQEMAESELAQAKQSIINFVATIR